MNNMGRTVRNACGGGSVTHQNAVKMRRGKSPDEKRSVPSSGSSPLRKAVSSRILPEHTATGSRTSNSPANSARYAWCRCGYSRLDLLRLPYPLNV